MNTTSVPILQFRPTPADVQEACRSLAFGADRNWAQFGPGTKPDVLESEARAILADGNIAEIVRRIVAPKYEDCPNANINDAGSIAYSPWFVEIFRRGLGVELEHGLIASVNVTGNHPVLTGMIVLAHFAESLLYYHALQAAELENDLIKQSASQRIQAPDRETYIELQRARAEYASHALRFIG
jgi:hypothetical protein